MRGRLMPIKVKCENCGKIFALKDEAAGRKVKCAACHEIIEIPQYATPASASSQNASLDSHFPEVLIFRGAPPASVAAAELTPLNLRLSKGPKAHITAQLHQEAEHRQLNALYKVAVKRSRGSANVTASGTALKRREYEVEYVRHSLVELSRAARILCLTAVAVALCMLVLGIVPLAKGQIDLGNVGIEPFTSRAVLIVSPVLALVGVTLGSILLLTALAFLVRPRSGLAQCVAVVLAITGFMGALQFFLIRVTGEAGAASEALLQMRIVAVLFFALAGVGHWYLSKSRTLSGAFGGKLRDWINASTKLDFKDQPDSAASEPRQEDLPPQAPAYAETTCHKCGERILPLRYFHRVRNLIRTIALIFFLLPFAPLLLLFVLYRSNRYVCPECGALLRQ